MTTNILLQTLQTRFNTSMKRHDNLTRETVQSKLEAHPKILETISQMEATGWEPDVVSFSDYQNQIIFCDCSADTPKGRRSLCYDRSALNARKENKPVSSARDMANEIGIQLLTEKQYRELQELGEFDLKTSSWIDTPEKVRKLWWALFCDRRFDTVFTYHNGAESYYAGRSFRGLVVVG